MEPTNNQIMEPTQEQANTQTKLWNQRSEERGYGGMEASQRTNKKRTKSWNQQNERTNLYPSGTNHKTNAIMQQNNQNYNWTTAWKRTNETTNTIMEPADKITAFSEWTTQKNSSDIMEPKNEPINERASEAMKPANNQQHPEKGGISIIIQISPQIIPENARNFLLFFQKIRN